MNKMFDVSRYEYKMQIKRISGWLVFLFVLASAMMDSLPTTDNLKRVEFLYDIHYYVRRIYSFDGLILLFALMYLIAGRLVGDRNTGLRDLFMAAPIGKRSYIGGKLLGNFLYALSLMYLLLAAAIIGFAVFSHSETEIIDYIRAFFEVSVYIILPATFFVTASSIMLPEIMDIRLFYLVFSVLFLVNAFSSDTGTAEPFFLFTQGDLAKMIWHHPRRPMVYLGSAVLNLLFMLGIGGLSIVLVSCKRNFWRAD